MTWDDPFSWGVGCSGIKDCRPVGGGGTISVFLICCPWIKGPWHFGRRLRRLPWTSPVSDNEYVRK